MRRSAHLVRPRWVKVVVLVALTNALVLAVGPLLGTALILGTSLPFAVSNAVAGIVYALLVPLVALNTVYVYADIVVRDELEPRVEKGRSCPPRPPSPERPPGQAVGGRLARGQRAGGRRRTRTTARPMTSRMPTTVALRTSVSPNVATTARAASAATGSASRSVRA